MLVVRVLRHRGCPNTTATTLVRLSTVIFRALTRRDVCHLLEGGVVVSW